LTSQIYRYIFLTLYSSPSKQLFQILMHLVFPQDKKYIDSYGFHPKFSSSVLCYPSHKTYLLTPLSIRNSESFFLISFSLKSRNSYPCNYSSTISPLKSGITLRFLKEIFSFSTSAYHDKTSLPISLLVLSISPFFLKVTVSQMQLRGTLQSLQLDKQFINR
jgi:hypothetical protein